MSRSPSWHVAIFGATGAVGRTMIARLERSEIAVERLLLLASPRSAGCTLSFRGVEHPVRAVTAEAFQGIDVALFSAGGAASGEWAPVACARGAAVIDNSSRWRMDPEVPLIVPEVNGDLLPPRATEAAGGRCGALVANPNCSTIQLVVALEPLRRRFGLRRVFVATYQSASGAGQKGIDALAEEQRDGVSARGVFPRRLLGNVVPQVDLFLDDAWTREEEKTLRESRKILRMPELAVHPTCVRVPVEVGHSEAVYVECAQPVEVEEARRVLRAAPGVELADREGSPDFRTAHEIAGTDPVWVGRVRGDRCDPCGLHLWVVADNLRKGAATNAVQIAELWWDRER